MAWIAANAWSSSYVELSVLTVVFISVVLLLVEQEFVLWVVLVGWDGIFPDVMGVIGLGCPIVPCSVSFVFGYQCLFVYHNC